MGEVVSIAGIEAEDGPAMVAAVRRSAGLHRGWIAPPATMDAFYAWRGRLGDAQAASLVRHCHCGELVGYVTVQNIVRRAFQSASLGYGVFAGHEGLGLMSAGVGQVVALAFTPDHPGLGLHRLVVRRGFDL